MLAPDQWSAAAFRFPSNCTFSLRKGFSTDLPGSVEVECNLEAGWEWRGDLQNFTPLMWKIGLSVDPFFQGCAQSPHSQLRKPIIPVEDGYEKELMSFLVVSGASAARAPSAAACTTRRLNALSSSVSSAATQDLHQFIAYLLLRLGSTRHCRHSSSEQRSTPRSTGGDTRIYLLFLLF